MKNRTYIPIPVFAALLWSAMASCGNNPEPEGSPSEVSKDTVQAFILRLDTIGKTVSIPGELKPYQQVELSAKVQGYVKQMKVDVGDRVSNGQTLAVLEAPEVNTQVTQAEASRSAAKSRFEASKDKYNRLLRASQNPSPGIVAPADLFAMKSQMESDSATLLASDRQTRMFSEVSGYLTLRAPFSGIITDRKADAGTLVPSNSTLLTLQDNDRLRLRLAVPEAYAIGATTDPEIHFTSDVNPQRTFTARLTRRSGSIDPVTRTELWEYDIVNGDHALKAGAFLNVRLHVSREHPGFLVPPTSVATTLEKKFIIRSDVGKVKWIDVRQGMTTEKGIEIFGDIHEGDTVLLKATDERKPGTSIRVLIKK